MSNYMEEHINFMAIKLAKRPNSCADTDLDHASGMLFQLMRDCNDLREQVTLLRDTLDYAARTYDSVWTKGMPIICDVVDEALAATEPK